ncbi:MAG: 3-hydroxyacyl-CoA dehydrogenase NAD-binding domain-containing protein [Desulfobacula sp.]|nr:3-hydroxyacyl-CoA dehydrogenase NAD-binding domain-containing protein [Desulfobacula sp.]
MDSIKNVLIPGSGTMGLQIGLKCTLYGFNVTIYDAHEQALKKSVDWF